MKALQDMKQAGAEIIDPAPVDLSQVRRDQNAGVCMGFKYDINAYLAAQGGRVPVHNQEETTKTHHTHPTTQQQQKPAHHPTPQHPNTNTHKAKTPTRKSIHPPRTKTTHQ